VEDREKILRAVRDKNGKLGAQLMREHVENGGEGLMKYIQEAGFTQKRDTE
jgi:DNA-binding GntR family transcriptional regulator